MRKAVINITTNEVENIIEYADRGLAIRLPIGYTIYDCSLCAAEIGDTFENGIFYRNGVAIETIPSDSDRLTQLEAELSALAGLEE